LVNDDASELVMVERDLYQCRCDLHTFALAPDGDYIFVGHLNGGLTMLTSEGDVVWRHDHTAGAPAGVAWSVAYAQTGALVYAGCGSSTNTGDYGLCLMDAGTGALLRMRRFCFPITALHALHGDLGVIVATPIDGGSDKIIAYAPDLETVRWERQISDPITALAVSKDGKVVALGGGHDGKLMLLDAHQGTVLAQDLLYGLVNAISVQGEATSISVVTQSNHVRTLKY
jgi:WD40 repeat protein